MGQRSNEGLLLGKLMFEGLHPFKHHFHALPVDCHDQQVFLFIEGPLARVTIVLDVISALRRRGLRRNRRRLVCALPWVFGRCGHPFLVAAQGRKSKQGQARWSGGGVSQLKNFVVHFHPCKNKGLHAA